MTPNIEKKVAVIEASSNRKIGEICKALDLPEMASDIFDLSDDEWQRKYPEEYIKLKSHVRHGERRTPLELGANTVIGWISEELAIRLLQRLSFIARIERNGSDQGRKFDYMMHTKSVPDLVAFFNDGRPMKSIEVTVCTGDYISKHHGQTLRLDKLKNLKFYKSLLLTIDWHQGSIYISNAAKLQDLEPPTNYYNKPERLALLEDDIGNPLDGVLKRPIPQTFWQLG